MSDRDVKGFREDRPKVVITDFDYGNIDIERAILERVGAEVIGLQAKSEADLFDAARDTRLVGQIWCWRLWSGE